MRHPNIAITAYYTTSSQPLRTGISEATENVAVGIHPSPAEAAVTTSSGPLPDQEMQRLFSKGTTAKRRRLMSGADVIM